MVRTLVLLTVKEDWPVNEVLTASVRYYPMLHLISASFSFLV